MIGYDSPVSQRGLILVEVLIARCVQGISCDVPRDIMLSALGVDETYVDILPICVSDAHECFQCSVTCIHVVFDPLLSSPFSSLFTLRILILSGNRGSELEVGAFNGQDNRCIPFVSLQHQGDVNWIALFVYFACWTSFRLTLLRLTWTNPD